MNKFRILLAVLFYLSLQGCMTYSHHELAQARQWPLAQPSKTKPAAYLKVQSEFAFNEDRANSNADIAALEKVLQEEFLSSQRFSKVTTQQQASDVYVTATLRNHEEGSLGLAFVTGFTFFLIPSKSDNTVSLDLTFRDVDGKKLGQVSKQEKLTTWRHLVLVFAVPFNDSSDRLIRELARSALEEAAGKGLI
ncbi:MULTISPECIES: hypothetical protein [Pseudomonas syringae group]|uniref:Lipoprotein n=2 Tax=Pseudomonas syringae group TaxID=136849 RepID=A0ABX6HB34_9PSED|nr:hypothetical protein [Pseudomonas asturiensis]QHF02776.1 hypothetical protein N015_10290 [Pseudomonas asturiensis]